MDEEKWGVAVMEDGCIVTSLDPTDSPGDLVKVSVTVSRHGPTGSDASITAVDVTVGTVKKEGSGGNEAASGVVKMLNVPYLHVFRDDLPKGAGEG